MALCNYNGSFCSLEVNPAFPIFPSRMFDAVVPASSFPHMLPLTFLVPVELNHHTLYGQFSTTVCDLVARSPIKKEAFINDKSPRNGNRETACRISSKLLADYFPNR
jgi:hypothetical protein